MKKISAGLLIYRKNTTGIKEVLLVHPGGPYFKNKDNGSWTIPKGEIEKNESPLQAAIREFKEELGLKIKADDFTALKPVIQKGGKEVFAFASEQDVDCTDFRSNLVEIEFPYKSGKKISFPEIDKAQWFHLNIALQKINPTQVPFLSYLNEL